MQKDILVLSGTVIDDSMRFTLIEMCECAKTSPEHIIEMVEEGILEVEGGSIDSWKFNSIALKRVQVVLRLEQDLGVNLPGSALALDLLDEIENLRQNQFGYTYP